MSRKPYRTSNAANRGRTPYRGDTKGETVVTKAAPKKKGGGFFSHIPGSKIVSQGAKDVYHAAVNTPAGVYYTGKAAEGDILTGLKHGQTPVEALIHGKNTRQMAKDYGKQLKSEVQHPLRHPGNTALDVLGIASLGAGTAARVGAVGKVAREGGSLGDAARVVRHGPAPGVRTFKVGDLEVTAPASRSAGTRATQRLLDARRNRAAAAKPSGRAARVVTKKAGKALEETLRHEEAIAKAPAEALHALGNQLKPHEQWALRMVAEEAPVDRRIAALEKRVGETKGSTRRRLAKRLDLTRQAKLLLTEENGKPALTSEKLKTVYGKMEQVAGHRESLAKELGLLAEDAIQGRKTAAGRAAMGSKYEAPTPGKLGLPSKALVTKQRRVASLERRYEQALKQAREKLPPAPMVHTRTGYKKVAQVTAPEKALARQHLEVPAGPKTPGVRSELPQKGTYSAKAQRIGAALSVARDELASAEASAGARVKPTGMIGNEDFTASPKAVYVPDIEQRVGKSGNVSSMGAQGTIGHPANPIKQGYTGQAKALGREPIKTTKAVAQANLAVTRFHRILNLRTKIAKAAAPTPRFKDDIAIRLDKLKAHETLPHDVRKFIDDPTELAPDEATRLFEKVRKSVLLAPENAAEFEKLHAAGKIGWVPKKLLGDLAHPAAPLTSVVGKAPVAVLDGVNNAQRLAILYLKPAYAAPNVLGNAALTIVHQGFAAPKNVAFASRMHWSLGPELTARVDAMVGEGVAASLQGEAGVGAKATQGLAHIWSKGVDRPFRRAAFFHEAKLAGFKTPSELEKLLTDPANHDTLINVTKRANRELIDYGRLSSRERQVIRRVIFFYPWVKGSAMYAGHFLAEHPVKAAVAGQVGEYGRKKALASTGPVPTNLEGAFKAGGGLVNPSSAGILGTPAQTARVAAGLMTGDVSRVAKGSAMMTPALSLALALATKQDPGTGYKYKQGENVAADQLVGGLPQLSLLHGLQGKQTSKTYRDTKKSTVGKFFLGGLYPRPYNRGVLNSSAAKEKAGR